jgi:hypothetical protein
MRDPVAPMPTLDFIYPIAVAFDVAALVACLVAPILAVVSLRRWGWQRARATLAYLGYLCCALLATSFAVHFALDGGEIFMVFVFWAVPFGIAMAVALLLTVAIDSSKGLWTLAAATILLGLGQVVADLSPGGIGGAVAVLLLLAYLGYPVLVLVVTVRRHQEWWHSSRGEA